MADKVTAPQAVTTDETTKNNVPDEETPENETVIDDSTGSQAGKSDTVEADEETPADQPDNDADNKDDTASEEGKEETPSNEETPVDIKAATEIIKNLRNDNKRLRKNVNINEIRLEVALERDIKDVRVFRKIEGETKEDMLASLDELTELFGVAKTPNNTPRKPSGIPTRSPSNPNNNPLGQSIQDKIAAARRGARH